MGKRTVLTPAFRCQYVYVTEVNKPMQADQVGKYSLTMLFPKGTDLSEMITLAEEEALEKFGADRTKWPKLKSPFRDQGEKLKEGFEPGAMFCNATSKQRPGLVDQDLKDIIEPRHFYAGCWARAQVNAFFYDAKGNKGISFGLNHVQKLRDDKPLSGRGNPQDAFTAVKNEDGKPAANPSSIFG